MSRPFPVSTTLTAIAIAYKNPASILLHKKVLPPLGVLSENFKWNIYPISEAFTVPDLEVGRTGQVGRATFSATEADSSTKDYGLDSPVPNSDIKEAETARQEKRSHFDPLAAATEGLTNQIELGREIRAAQIVQDPNNYAADKKITLAGSDQFSHADSDPYALIDDGMDKTLVYRPNTISMGQPVWSILKRNKKLINAVKGGLTEEGAISKRQFAELFEIELENLLIGAAQVNMARKGQEVSLDRVWGNSVQLTYIDPSKQAANDAVMTWGFTAELGTRIAGSEYDRNIGLTGGEIVRVGERVRELVCAKDLGYQLNNVI